MKKNTKRVFSLATFLKLFLITGLTAGNPVNAVKGDDGKVTVVYLTNDSFKQKQPSVMLIHQKLLSVATIDPKQAKALRKRIFS